MSTRTFIRVTDPQLPYQITKTDNRWIREGKSETLFPVLASGARQSEKFTATVQIYHPEGRVAESLSQQEYTVLVRPDQVTHFAPPNARFAFYLPGAYSPDDWYLIGATIASRSNPLVGMSLGEIMKVPHNMVQQVLVPGKLRTIDIVPGDYTVNIDWGGGGGPTRNLRQVKYEVSVRAGQTTTLKPPFGQLTFSWHGIGMVRRPNAEAEPNFTSLELLDRTGENNLSPGHEGGPDGFNCLPGQSRTITLPAGDYLGKVMAPGYGEPFKIHIAAGQTATLSPSVGFLKMQGALPDDLDLALCILEGDKAIRLCTWSRFLDVLDVAPGSYIVLMIRNGINGLDRPDGRYDPIRVSVTPGQTVLVTIPEPHEQ